MGQIIKGSPNVKVNGIPVGRVGDATLDSGGVSSVAGLTGGSNGVISTTDLQTALSLGSAAQLSTGTGADQIPTTADADSRYAQRSNNLSDLTNVATAVSNLRLANVATSGSYVDLNNKPTSWSWNVITSTPTTLAGYGIVDAVANSQVGVANGITPLGADAKISTTYMPTAVLGQVSYQGTWDASTGSPPTTTPTKGWYYIVTVSGSTNLSGITDWVVGDWAIYNGTAWNKVDNTDAVSSVAGLVGVISTASLQTALGLSTVATSGNYADLIGKPVLATVATTGNYADLNGKPTLGTAASQDTTAFATAAQGATADAAMPKAGGAFTGNIGAPNLSGTNTGDQDLSGLMPKAGGTFTGQLIGSVGTSVGVNWVEQIGPVNMTGLGLGSGVRFGANFTTGWGGADYGVRYSGGIAYLPSTTSTNPRDHSIVLYTDDIHTQSDIPTPVAQFNWSGLYIVDNNAMNLRRQPRTFVQSTDPGAAAADGDLWFW